MPAIQLRMPGWFRVVAGQFVLVCVGPSWFQDRKVPYPGKPHRSGPTWTGQSVTLTAQLTQDAQ